MRGNRGPERFRAFRPAPHHSFRVRDKITMATGALAGAAIGGVPHYLYPRQLSEEKLGKVAQARLKANAEQKAIAKKQAEIQAAWSRREVAEVGRVLEPVFGEVRQALKEHGANPESRIDFTVKKNNLGLTITPDYGTSQQLHNELVKITQRCAIKINNVVTPLEAQAKAEKEKHHSERAGQIRAELQHRPPVQARDVAASALAGSSFVLGGTLLGVAAAKTVKNVIGRMRAAKASRRGRAVSHQIGSERPPSSGGISNGGVQRGTVNIAGGKGTGMRKPQKVGRSFSPIHIRQLLLGRLRRIANKEGLTGGQIAKMIARADKERVQPRELKKIIALARAIKTENEEGLQGVQGNSPQEKVSNALVKSGNVAKHQFRRITPERSVSLIRIFHELGFEQNHRGRGDHRVLVHTDGRIVSIPFHNEDLSPDLILRLIREGAVTRQEYLLAKGRV